MHRRVNSREVVYRDDMKERKKYGLKGARRAPQFSKR
ncbi:MULTISPECIES: 30S ribosomal protein S9 [unclassified Sutcliffiella]